MQKQIHLAPQTAEEDAYSPSSAVSSREFKILRKKVSEDKAELLAQITVTADEIALKASKTYVDGQVSSLQSQITVTADEIALKASKTYVDGQVSSLQSQITVNAGNIALKVSSTDYNGNTIASLINQTATTIQISAEKLNLNGFVTLTNLTDGATTISGANIKTGAISATSVTIGGWSLNSSQIYKGAIKLDSANERIYLNSAAFLYAYADTSFIGVSGGLVASAHVGGTYFGATSGSKYAEYNTSNIVCRDGSTPVALQMNGSNIITRANFSLVGTTLTITM